MVILPYLVTHLTKYSRILLYLPPTQFVTNNTRNDNILDLVLSNDDCIFNLSIDTHFSYNTSTSDHLSITANIFNTNVITMKSKTNSNCNFNYSLCNCSIYDIEYELI